MLSEWPLPHSSLSAPALRFKNRVTEHSFPNYFSTIANCVSTRYEYSDALDRVTLVSRADGIANAESHTTYWYANPTFVAQFRDQTLVGDGALKIG